MQKPKTSKIGKPTRASPKSPTKGNGKKRGKKELTKAEVRHNAALKAWETRKQNGWTPKPRRPRLTTNIIEIDDEKPCKGKNEYLVQTKAGKQIPVTATSPEKALEKAKKQLGFRTTRSLRILGVQVPKKKANSKKELTPAQKAAATRKKNREAEERKKKGKKSQK